MTAPLPFRHLLVFSRDAGVVLPSSCTHPRPAHPSMPQKLFDEKFGADFTSSLPTGPGVYCFLNEHGAVIYVGKAKNLRRRLQGYRAAGRKKVHRKMARLVRTAATVSYEALVSEEAALLRENQLIQELRPAFNVDGAYAFLYPAIGVATSGRQTLLCLTTTPEAYAHLDLSWFGTFRSRPRAKLAFQCLVDLLGIIGHREKRTALPPHPALRGSRLVGLRQLPMDLTESLPWFLAADAESFVGSLAHLLLSKPQARREAEVVEEKLKILKGFYEMDALGLRDALRRMGRPGSFVPGSERDALFIQARSRSIPD